MSRTTQLFATRCSRPSLRRLGPAIRHGAGCLRLGRADQRARHGLAVQLDVTGCRGRPIASTKSLKSSTARSALHMGYAIRSRLTKVSHASPCCGPRHRDIIAALHGDVCVRFARSGPRSADCGAHRGRPLRRREHRRGARAGRATSRSAFCTCRAPEIELAGADRPARRCGLRAGGDELRAAQRQPRSSLEDEPSLYFYRLRTGDHDQTGLAGCFSIDEYDRGRHQEARADATRQGRRSDAAHARAARADRPVFLTYRASRRRSIDRRRAGSCTASRSSISTRRRRRATHALARDRRAIATRWWRRSAAFRRSTSPTVITARRAPRGRAAARCASGSLPRRPRRRRRLHARFWRWRSRDNQVRILPYNRIVQDLGGLAPSRFCSGARRGSTVEPGPATPARGGEIAMYFEGGVAHAAAAGRRTAARRDRSLDVSVLQDRLLAPVLKIADVRTDTRIEFVGGARGTAALEAAVDPGRAAVAFSLFPVSVADLMAVVRRRRDHAAQEHLVRAQAAGRAADSRLI